MKSFLFLGLTALVACGGDDSNKPVDGGVDQSSGSDAAPTDAAKDSAPADAPTGSDASDAIAPPAGNTVQGIVSRTSSSTLVASGKGTIWIDVGPTCPYTQSFTSAQTITVTGVDMSNPATTVPYSMTSVPAGTYYVWGWLDETNSTPTSTPFPNHALGDTVCPQVTVTNTSGAIANLVFTTVIN